MVASLRRQGSGHQEHQAKCLRDGHGYNQPHGLMFRGRVSTAVSQIKCHANAQGTRME